MQNHFGTWKYMRHPRTTDLGASAGLLRGLWLRLVDRWSAADDAQKMALEAPIVRGRWGRRTYGLPEGLPPRHDPHDPDDGIPTESCVICDRYAVARAALALARRARAAAARHRTPAPATQPANAPAPAVAYTAAPARAGAIT